MPAKKTALSQVEQSRRFLEAAEEVGVDGALFERAFGVVSNAPAQHIAKATLTPKKSQAKMRPAPKR